MDNNTTNKTQRVRGSARIQPDGTFDFKPDGQGVKKIEEVRQARKSRCYRCRLVNQAGAQGDSPPVHFF